VPTIVVHVKHAADLDLPPTLTATSHLIGRIELIDLLEMTSTDSVMMDHGGGLVPLQFQAPSTAMSLDKSL
jgi:hypothetical protein